MTASTTSSTTGGNIVHTANGSGLVPGQVATATHATSGTTNSWATLDDPATVNLTFNLNGSFNLAGMTIWNANFFDNFRGIQAVSVLSSVGGLVFTPIVGAPMSFAQGPEAVPSAADGTFAWAPVTATHVQFLVGSAHEGGAGIVFNEVLFDGAASAPVPEMGLIGAMAPLTIACLSLLILGSRGKRCPPGVA